MIKSKDKPNEVEKDSNLLKNKHVKSEIYKKLANIVGKDHIRESKLEDLLYNDDIAPLSKEISTEFKTVPVVIVKPQNSLDVSRIIKFAVKNNITVTVMGKTAREFGGILLDMKDMQKILEINKESLYVTVEPGVNWMKLYDIILNEDLLIGAYPNNAPEASVGDWVNTGGVGIGSYKYGGIDQQIRSLEVVLPDGNIINTGFKNVVNNSSGYNLSDLFVGSEGTLGIITKMTLKLFPTPEEIRPSTYVFPDLEEAGKAILSITRTNINPYHIAFLDGTHFDILRDLGKDVPEVGAVVNIIFSGNSRIIDIEEKKTEEIMKNNGGKKQTKEFANHEWTERFFESREHSLGPGLIVAEGYCPLPRFIDLTKGSQRALKMLKMKGGIVGYITDPNTVLFMTYAISNEQNLIKNITSMALEKKLTDEILRVGGRPGEFGLLFRRNIKKINGGRVFLMDDIKTALDPYKILNSRKLI
ncbi:MAG: FAD-binding oxidoreductase [Thermoplasmatales archaeon]|nr:MAG: FAD-binding oxidoreductase [Thermoplasmatales archaeon]